MRPLPHVTRPHLHADKAWAGLRALARADAVVAPGAAGWVIRVPTEGRYTRPGGSCYPTQMYGGVTLTRRPELAMRFSTEGDAREAGYVLRDEEDLFDRFDAVLVASGPQASRP